MLKKLLLIIFVLLFVLSVIVCCFMIIYRADAENKVNGLLHKSKESFQKVYFEEGSIVHKKDFESFALLSYASINEDNLILDGNKIIIKEDFFIESKKQDLCLEVNCFYRKVDLSDLNPILWKGLMGIEDYRFFNHRGIDYLSILRAILVDLKAMKIVQGGSTLTQQLVKNLFLTSEKKISRKFKELIYASYLEKIMSKEEIITSYFNTVYWGSFQNIKIRGIGAAAIAYFEKKASDLTPFESIFLIGMLKGPYYYSPIKNLNLLKDRVEVVFERLRSLNLISDQQKWSDLKWKEWHRRFLIRNKRKTFKNFSLIRGDSFLNLFEEYVLLSSAERMKNKMKSSFKNKDIAIKIYANSINHLENQEFKFYSKIERNLNTALFKEKHQVASILKPLVYDYFFMQGLSKNELISNKSLTLNLKSGPWTPRNSTKTDESKVSLGYALRKSKNIPLIRLSKEFGFKKLETFLLSYIDNLKTPLSEYPAQILGSVELSLSEVFKIYKSFLNSRCLNKNEGTSTIDILSSAKETTLAKVANKNFRKLKVFGKTGTSNLGLDNWFVGFDSKEIFIIWTGQETDRKNRLVASGATTSFRIFQDFFLHRGRRVNELICQ